MVRQLAVALVVAVSVCTPSLCFSQAAVAPKLAFTAEELMAHVNVLAAPAMQGRETQTPGNAKAREWILGQFKAAGLQAIGERYEMPFSFERRAQPKSAAPSARMQGINVVGLCRGQGAKDNSAIVITAHYDHVGVRDGAIHHGADDNASGVAVLLGLARQCRVAPWTHDAVFVALDAEEMGLQGARAFVAAPPLAKERLAIDINMDMVARGDKGEIYIAGTHHHPALMSILQPVASRAPIKVSFGHDSGGGQNDWTSQSDHGAFHAAGIPFVYFGVEDHPDYHKPTDTPEKINSGFFFNAAQVILEAVTAIDRALPLPAK